MKPDEYKKLREAKLKQVKAKHEEDVIAGRTIRKEVKKDKQ